MCVDTWNFETAKIYDLRNRYSGPEASQFPANEFPQYALCPWPTLGDGHTLFGKNVRARGQHIVRARRALQLDRFEHIPKQWVTQMVHLLNVSVP